MLRHFTQYTVGLSISQGICILDYKCIYTVKTLSKYSKEVKKVSRHFFAYLLA